MRRKMLAVLAGTVVGAVGLLGMGERALAWNSVGHETVAEIAWENMTPAARARATQLLKEHPQYKDLLINKTVTDPKEADRATFVLTATWSDMIRSTNLNSKNHLYHRPVWHYSDFPFIVGDLPPGTPTPKTPSEEWKPGEEPGNLLQAYHKAIAELKDPKIPEDQKAVDLAWVEHLVGDIHQPLHAVSMYSVETPNGDQGGNGTIVNVESHIGNLHSLWDGMLGGYESDKLNLVDQIAKRTETDNPKSSFPDAQLKDLEVHDWAQESYKVAKDVVYANGKIPHVAKSDRNTPVPEMPKEYMEVARPLARTRAALAGYRLAEVLNDLFADGAIEVPASAPASAPASEPAMAH